MMPTVAWLVFVLTEALRWHGAAQSSVERVSLSKVLGMPSFVLWRLRPGSILLGELVRLVGLVLPSNCRSERLVDLKDGNGWSSFFVCVDPDLAWIWIKQRKNKRPVSYTARKRNVKRVPTFRFFMYASMSCSCWFDATVASPTTSLPSAEMSSTLPFVFDI